MIGQGMSSSRLCFRGHVVFFLVAACALAYCSLAYELILAKLIAELTGNPLLWENLSMGSFLLGLGARSLAHKALDDRAARRALVRTEIAIMMAMVMSVLGILGAEMVYRIYVYSDGLGRTLWPFPPVWVLGGLSQVAPFAVGWLSGFELLFFLHFKNGGLLKRQEAKVLATYHLGALLATLSFPWFLLKSWSPVDMAICVTAINFVILMAILLFFRSRGILEYPNAMRRSSLAAVVIASLVVLSPHVESLSRKNFYHNRLSWVSDARGIYDYRNPVSLLDLVPEMEKKPAVERIRTPYQVIDMIRLSKEGDHKSHPSAGVLHINGRFQIDSSSASEYHEPMVHVAMGFGYQPVRRVLVLGGGDGALAKELRRYDASIQEVVLVDIDAQMIQLARTEPFLRQLNGDVFSWPKLKVMVGDAMSYLRDDSSLFDAIFLDLTYPYEFDSARFYSLEFFRLMRSRLEKSGFFVLGSPVDLIASGHAQWQDVLYSTVNAAGYPVQIAINGKQDHFLVAGMSELRPEPIMDAAVLQGAHAARLTVGVRTKRLSRKVRPDFVNSVMRPRSLGVEDTFF